MSIGDLLKWSFVTLLTLNAYRVYRWLGWRMDWPLVQVVFITAWNAVSLGCFTFEAVKYIFQGNPFWVLAAFNSAVWFYIFWKLFISGGGGKRLRKWLGSKVVVRGHRLAVV